MNMIQLRVNNYILSVKKPIETDIFWTLLFSHQKNKNTSLSLVMNDKFSEWRTVNGQRDVVAFTVQWEMCGSSIGGLCILCVRDAR